MKEGKLNFWGKSGFKFPADSGFLLDKASVTAPKLRNTIKGTCVSPDVSWNRTFTQVLGIL
jgi:hypothetical protein